MHVMPCISAAAAMSATHCRTPECRASTARQRSARSCPPAALPPRSRLLPAAPAHRCSASGGPLGGGDPGCLVVNAITHKPHTHTCLMRSADVMPITPAPMTQIDGPSLLPPPPAAAAAAVVLLAARACSPAAADRSVVCCAHFGFLKAAQATVRRRTQGLQRGAAAAALAVLWAMQCLMVTPGGGSWRSARPELSASKNAALAATCAGLTGGTRAPICSSSVICSCRPLISAPPCSAATRTTLLRQNGQQGASQGLQQSGTSA